jgi:serine/threonine-protein kinase
MGRVYRAIQHSVGREVAIKVIRGSFGGDSTAARRFVREARLACQINHPNTVSIYDFGKTLDGLLFLVMEIAPGRSLRAVLEDRGRLSAEEGLRVAAQIADGLGAAHELGIIHRDLKPANVVLNTSTDEGPLIKILDFGLARTLETVDSVITEDGKLVGTVGYMAPEIIRNEAPGPSSDQYALGVMLYELLSGARPFSGNPISVCPLGCGISCTACWAKYLQTDIRTW